MAGLDLRTREGALRGGTRGAAIVPGHPEKSLLIELVKGQGKLRMPMGSDLLPEAEIATLTEWVRGGAEWGAAAEWDAAVSAAVTELTISTAKNRKSRRKHRWAQFPLRSKPKLTAAN